MVWVNVKDRLPKEGQEVIAVVTIFRGGLKEKTKAVCTRFENGRFMFFALDECYFVSCRMPLPDIPE